MLTGWKFEIFLLSFPLSSRTTRAVFAKSGKMFCSILNLIDSLFVKFYFIAYLYAFHDNCKKWFSVAVLAFVHQFWVVADKSGFHPLAEKKIRLPEFGNMKVFIWHCLIILFIIKFRRSRRLLGEQNQLKAVVLMRWPSG